MRLPIVDNAERPVELDWLRISRVARPPVVHARLDVRQPSKGLGRFVYGAHHPDHEADLAELDAMLAGELVAAVRVLLDSQDATIDEPPSGDDLHYEIEVSWAGVEHRYVVVGDPTEDALGGVLRLALPLLDAAPRITSIEP